MRTITCIALFAIAATIIVVFTTARAQQPRYKRFDQDPSLNNLVHAEGYQTCQLGDLGRVTKVGNGPRPMILIAAGGFGGDVFDGFMRSRKKRFTMYAVTLPGFGGTLAPPVPAPGTSYGDQTWSRAAQGAIERLIEEERLENPVIVAHWYAATQIALRLALDVPDKIDSVVIISGVARYGATTLRAGTPIKERARAADQLAQRWFKTVTRDTWDDNNFLPGDYAIHPVRALQLWRQAAAAPLPVWVRYLCESWSQDVTQELDQLRVPTLILKPGFDEDFYYVADRPYMHTYCHGSWDGAAERSNLITIQTIDNSRVFMMDDQPERLDEAVNAFLAKGG